MTDPIADMLIRIKNALMARHDIVEMPYSKMRQSIAQIMQETGYLESVAVDESGQFPVLKLTLKYVGKLPAVNGVKRISKPGRRLYSTVNKIPKTLGGYGVTIVSTSKGVMSDTQARKQNVGGELLCQIW